MYVCVYVCRCVYVRVLPKIIPKKLYFRQISLCSDLLLLDYMIDRFQNNLLNRELLRKVYYVFFVSVLMCCLKQASLSGHPKTLEYKRFQDFLNSMGLILNLIQGHSTILSLKKEV